MVASGGEMWYGQKEGRWIDMGNELRDKAEYDRNYIKENLIYVNLTFNKRKPDDLEILEWATNQPESRVSYIKRLIREDMERNR